MRPPRSDSDCSGPYWCRPLDRRSRCERPASAPCSALLLRANRVVAADELADQVWDGVPPAGAAATLPSYVLRLRRALGPVAGGRLQTRSPGYLIEVREDSELDLRLFRSPSAHGPGRGCRSGLERRGGRLAGGQLSGSGAALEDVTDTYLKARELPVLREGWVQVHEALARADLELGRPGEVVEQVVRLQAEFPYREGLFHLLSAASQLRVRPQHPGQPARPGLRYRSRRAKPRAGRGDDRGGRRCAALFARRSHRRLRPARRDSRNPDHAYFPDRPDGFPGGPDGQLRQLRPSGLRRRGMQLRRFVLTRP
jgi:DNA-binding SARP family transcriptional activator